MHFNETEDKLKAKCTYCGQLLTTKNGNIGNLHRHLKNKHIGVTLERQSSQESQIPLLASTSGGGFLEGSAENAGTSIRGKAVYGTYLFFY